MYYKKKLELKRRKELELYTKKQENLLKRGIFKADFSEILVEAISKQKAEINSDFSFQKGWFLKSNTNQIFLAPNNQIKYIYTNLYWIQSVKEDLLEFIFDEIILIEDNSAYIRSNYTQEELLSIYLNPQHRIKIKLDSQLTIPMYYFNIMALKLNFISFKNIFFKADKSISLFYTTFIKKREKKLIYSLFNLYTYKFLLSFLYSRKINTLTTIIVKFFLLRFQKKNVNLLKFFLWKNNTKSIKTSSTSSVFYWMQQVEDQLDLTKIDTQNVSKKVELENLRTLLYKLIEDNQNNLKAKTNIPMNVNNIRDFRSLYWTQHFVSFLADRFWIKGAIFGTVKKTQFQKIIALLSKMPNFNKVLTLVRKGKEKKPIYLLNILRLLSTLYSSNKKYQKQVNTSFLKITKKNRRTTFPKSLKLKKKEWNKPLTYINRLLNKKIQFADEVFDYKQYQELISLVFGFKVNIYFINSLSLTRFEYHMQQQKKKKDLGNKRSSAALVNKLERDFVKRYKYIANYLQDFARVGFIALYTKNLTFLVKFMAFQLAHLQKNRKETRLIRFLSKAMRLFSALREEVVALKINFKGRVNRWRRTKIITGRRGIIPYNSYATRIEYATATSVTRKGALGIRLWVYYTQLFNTRIDKGFKQYINSNKILKHKEVLSKLLLNKKITYKYSKIKKCKPAITTWILRPMRTFKKSKFFLNTKKNHKSTTVLSKVVQSKTFKKFLIKPLLKPLTLSKGYKSVNNSVIKQQYSKK